MSWLISSLPLLLSLCQVHCITISKQNNGYSIEGCDLIQTGNFHQVFEVMLKFNMKLTTPELTANVKEFQLLRHKMFEKCFNVITAWESHLINFKTKAENTDTDLATLNNMKNEVDSVMMRIPKDNFVLLQDCLIGKILDDYSIIVRCIGMPISNFKETSDGEHIVLPYCTNLAEFDGDDEKIIKDEKIMVQIFHKMFLITSDLQKAEGLGDAAKLKEHKSSVAKQCTRILQLWSAFINHYNTKGSQKDLDKTHLIELVSLQKCITAMLGCTAIPDDELSFHHKMRLLLPLVGARGTINGIILNHLGLIKFEGEKQKIIDLEEVSVDIAAYLKPIDEVLYVDVKKNEETLALIIEQYNYLLGKHCPNFNPVDGDPKAKLK